MATIRKLTSKRTQKVHYNVQIRVKGYPAESATFDRLTDAKAWAADIEGAMRRGRHFAVGEAKRVTLAEVIDRYLVEILPGKKDHAMTRQRLNYWKAELGSRPLSEVTPVTISNVLRDKLTKAPIEARRNRGHRRSGATLNRYLMALAAVYRACIKEWHILAESPLKSISRRPEAAERVRYLTEDEEARLLGECKASKSQDLYDVILLSLRTGGRQSEVLRLFWTDVNLEENWVCFRNTKNRETRIVPLMDDAVAVLQRRSEKPATAGSALVFASPRVHGKPIELRRAFARAVARANIKDFRWHDLRHSTASTLAMNGAGLRDIAEVLGHKTLQMTKRYAHLSTDHMRRVMERAFVKPGRNER